MGQQQTKFDHGRFVPVHKGEFAGRYETVKVLGTGAQGTTYLTRRLSDGCEVVAKEPNDATEEGQAAFLKEFDRLRVLNHPNCMRVLELVRSPEAGADDKLFLISEFAKGGDLAAHLRSRAVRLAGYVTEEWVAGVFRQAMSGVAHLHDIGIVHNDLKPDNILVMNDIAPSQWMQVPEVVLADFGCATCASDFGFIGGDPRYMSPEAWRCANAYLRREQESSAMRVTVRADVYMMGVTLYELLSAGCLPFLGHSCRLAELLEDDTALAKLRDKVTGPDEVQLTPHCRGLSELCADLLKAMLLKDEEQRPHSAEALKHKWFRVRGKPIEAIKEKLAIREPKGRAHAALLCALAKSIDRHHQRASSRAFENANVDKSGSLTLAEFQAAMDSIFKDSGRMQDVDAERMFHYADLNGSGTLNHTEFLAVSLDWSSLPGEVLEKHLNELLVALDVDCDGKVSENDFINFLRDAAQHMLLRQIFAILDTDASGALSLEELRAFLFRPDVGRLQEPQPVPAASSSWFRSSRMSSLAEGCLFLCQGSSSPSRQSMPSIAEVATDTACPGGSGEASCPTPRQSSLPFSSDSSASAIRVSVAESLDIWQPIAARPPTFFKYKRHSSSAHVRRSTESEPSLTPRSEPSLTIRKKSDPVLHSSQTTTDKEPCRLIRTNSAPAGSLEDLFSFSAAKSEAVQLPVVQPRSPKKPYASKQTSKLTVSAKVRRNPSGAFEMVSDCTDTTLGSDETAVDTENDTEDDAVTQSDDLAMPQPALASETMLQRAMVDPQQKESIDTLQPASVDTPQLAQEHKSQMAVDVARLQRRWRISHVCAVVIASLAVLGPLAMGQFGTAATLPVASVTATVPDRGEIHRL